VFFFHKSKCRFQENITLLSSPFTVYLGITHVPECFSFQQHPRNQTTKWLSETNQPKGCQNLTIKELSEPNNERVLRIKQAKGSQNQTTKDLSERNNQRVVGIKQPKGCQNQKQPNRSQKQTIQRVLRDKPSKGLSENSKTKRPSDTETIYLK